MLDSESDPVFIIDSDSDIDDAVLSTDASDVQYPNKLDATIKNYSNKVNEENVAMETLLEDVDTVSLALRTAFPDVVIDPNVIFEQLELHSSSKNRVDQVVQLLGGLHAPVVSEQSQTEDDQLNGPVLNAEDGNVIGVTDSNGHDIPKPADFELQEPVIVISPSKPDKEVYNSLLNDVQKILEIFPDVNGEEVYAYLEARRHETNRVQNVIEELINRNPSNFGEFFDHNDNGSNASITDEIFDCDASIPNKRLKLSTATTPTECTSNTLMGPPAIVEELVELDSTLSAVEQVLEEIRQTESNVTMKAVESHFMDLIASNYDTSAGNSTTADPPTTSKATDSQLVDQFQVLKDTFPDADPEHLYALVCEFGKDEMQLQQHVAVMLEKKLYPKLKDRLEKERKEALKKKFSTNIFTPEEVLEWFDDPLTFFYDTTKPVSKNYEQHCASQLRNDFRRMTLNDIQHALVKHNHHYTPALHELQVKQAAESKSERYRRRKLRHLSSLPEEPDELFYKELAFTRIEDELRAFLRKKQEDCEQRFNMAKNNGELLTCNCCYDEENLLEDMIECGSGHFFCKECVRRGSEVAIGQGRTALDCMYSGCTTSFSLQSLQMVLKPNMFSNLLRKIQEAEISEAHIPDLVQCPYCTFAAIMPNPEDKVFRCLNPECFKETCRFCKEPNHIPLHCNEVEKADEVKMRTFIENKMTDALLRQCYNCKRRYMKSEGCNKMTCVCGASMCYVCRKPIKDYSHFQNGKCAQNSDTEMMHQNEVISGAEKAKKEYLEQHPEFTDIHLKHDPLKGLPNVIPQQGQGVHAQGQNQIFAPPPPPPHFPLGRNPIAVRRRRKKRNRRTIMTTAFGANTNTPMPAVAHNGTNEINAVQPNVPLDTRRIPMVCNLNTTQRLGAACISATTAQSTVHITIEEKVAHHTPSAIKVLVSSGNEIFHTVHSQTAQSSKHTTAVHPIAVDLKMVQQPPVIPLLKSTVSKGSSLCFGNTATFGMGAPGASIIQSTDSKPPVSVALSGTGTPFKLSGSKPPPILIKSLLQPDKIYKVTSVTDLQVTPWTSNSMPEPCPRTSVSRHDSASYINTFASTMGAPHANSMQATYPRPRSSLPVSTVDTFNKVFTSNPPPILVKSTLQPAKIHKFAIATDLKQTRTSNSVSASLPRTSLPQYDSASYLQTSSGMGASCVSSVQSTPPKPHVSLPLSVIGTRGMVLTSDPPPLLVKSNLQPTEIFKGASVHDVHEPSRTTSTISASHPHTSAVSDLKESGLEIEANPVTIDLEDSNSSLIQTSANSVSELTSKIWYEEVAQCSKPNNGTAAKANAVSNEINTKHSSTFDHVVSNAPPSEAEDTGKLLLITEEVNNINWNALSASFGASHVVTTAFPNER